MAYVLRQLRAGPLNVIFLLTLGALWAGAAYLLPRSWLYEPLVALMGGLFAALYVWALLLRIRLLLRDSATLARSLGAIGRDLSLLILTFAWIYSTVGMFDNSGPEPFVSSHFPTAVYYSVVTFTTLGYGDIYPLGVGRAIAAIQALVGYLVLATTASVAASILSPYERPKRDERSESELRNPETTGSE